MPRCCGNELAYLKEVLEHEFRTSWTGTMVRRLEAAFSAKYGIKHAIALCNGTATLHSILAARGIGPGDEVIVPALTMASTSLAVLHCGAVPVWADVDAETWTIDPDSIKERLSDRTRAIITVSLYGCPPEMDKICEIAKKHSLFLVEDNAQCFLGYFKGKLAGTFGDAASFSFQSSKHLTCGEGGIILTDNDELAQRIREFSCLGYKSGYTKEQVQSPKYERHHSLGYNYRMSDLQAAVALAQVEQIDTLVAWRQRAAVNLIPQLGKWFTLQGGNPGTGWFARQAALDMDHSAWAVPALFDHPAVSWEQFSNRLRACGGNAPYACWLPTYKEPMFRDWEYPDCYVAESIQPRIMAFPTNYFCDEDIDRQCEALYSTVQSL